MDAAVPYLIRSSSMHPFAMHDGGRAVTLKIDHFSEQCRARPKRGTIARPRILGRRTRGEQPGVHAVNNATTRFCKYILLSRFPCIFKLALE